MNKSDKIVFAIIAFMAIAGFAASSGDDNSPLIGEQILEGAQCVSEIADEISYSLKEAQEEAEKERLAELGYPDGYDPMNPVANGEFTEEDWDAIQQEDAMRSLAEDAMNEYYQEKPDISDHVLKP